MGTGEAPELCRSPGGEAWVRGEPIFPLTPQGRPTGWGRVLTLFRAEREAEKRAPGILLEQESPRFRFQEWAGGVGLGGVILLGVGAWQVTEICEAGLAKEGMRAGVPWDLRDQEDETGHLEKQSGKT